MKKKKDQTKNKRPGQGAIKSERKKEKINGSHK